MDETLRQRERTIAAITAALGLFVWIVILLFHNIADGDLWAKLSLGCQFWQYGHFPKHDSFAFTPVLPVYVDHEAGAGTIFYAALQWFGPSGLLLLKVLLASIALGAAFWLARRDDTNWPAILLLAAGSGFCLLPGYVVVLRSHAFTYALFGLLLVFLEALRKGVRWPLFALPLTMIAWVNLHGGFVAGLGIVGIYSFVAVLEGTRRREFIFVLSLCTLATFINPNGPGYWLHVLPAVLHKRPEIVEWRPMPLLGWDVFLGFRILALLVVAALIFGRRAEKRSWTGLCVLAVTFVLAMRSRRHAPFFGLAALAFVGPYLSCAMRAFWEKARWPQERFAIGVLVLYTVVAFWVALRFLPQVSLQVLAPVGQYPVREADILSRSGLRGNLVVPFHWGSYASWRLFSAVKVSIDGRYEAVYPDSTYLMDGDFFNKRGTDWDRILRQYLVDFVMIDFGLAKLRPADLVDRGFVLVWQQDGVSALLVRKDHAPLVQRVVAELPPTTIEPLDPAIPRTWGRL